MLLRHNKVSRTLRPWLRIYFLDFRLIVVSCWLRHVFLKVMRTNRRIRVKFWPVQRMVIIASDNLLLISILKLLVLKIQLRNWIRIRPNHLSRPDSWGKLLLFDLCVRPLCLKRICSRQRLLLLQHLKYGYITLSIIVCLQEVLVRSL